MMQLLSKTIKVGNILFPPEQYTLYFLLLLELLNFKAILDGMLA